MRKQIFLSIAAVFLIVGSIQAQNDTMYIMKNGYLISKYSVSNEIDSIVFYPPEIQTNAFTFTDERDGNEYKTVQIGQQVWMAENLKYLPSVSNPGSVSKTNPHYYVYVYNGTNVANAKATDNYKTYGVLYNWSAVMDGAASSSANPSGVQGVCPSGWHVPSKAEWEELINTVGGADLAGYKLKEAGTDHWNVNNTTDNQTGFTALPGGYLRNINLFDDIYNYGYWWSTTEKDSNDAFRIQMNYINGQVTIFGSSKETAAINIRCVMD